MAKTFSILAAALTFEAALGAVGVALAWWFAVPLGARLPVTPATAWRSAAALVPMLLLLVYVQHTRWRPLAELHEFVRKMVRELFAGARWWELATVAIAAGVGEELLFRGALQPLAERWLGAAAGLIVVSVVFGAMHAMSATYFVLATSVGLYLGWLAQRYDDLATPMFVHAAYDWAALMVLGRGKGGGG